MAAVQSFQTAAAAAEYRHVLGCRAAAVSHRLSDGCLLSLSIQGIRGHANTCVSGVCVRWEGRGGQVLEKKLLFDSDNIVGGERKRRAELLQLLKDDLQSKSDLYFVLGISLEGFTSPC